MFAQRLLSFQRVVFTLVFLLTAMGVYKYFSLPASEDPGLTIREANIFINKRDGHDSVQIRQIDHIQLISK